MTPDLDTIQNHESTLDELANEHSGINISGGTFTHVGGDLNHYHVQGNFHQNNSELGLYALGQSVSHGAIHDSSERFPPPKCHPETRHRVLQLIMEWIEDICPASTVLWVYGPAGAGKSAILQSVAEWCLESGNCGGSFFFARGKHGCDKGQYLFATIAYQLALNVPGLREHVDQIMTSMPSCHTKTMAIQIRALIVDSLSRLQGPPNYTPTVIIDGLDECEDHDVQQLILNLIAEALVVFKVPVRFLIASRPEAHIRETFDTPLLHSITHRIVLDESFNPNHDIEIYLRHGFETIYQKNVAIMSHIEKPWPAEGVVDLLVQKASGQFIYAATVLKFVGTELCRPSKQLEIILEPSPRSSTTFPDLDALYAQILSTSPDKKSLLLVLGTILALHCPQPPEVIEGILDLEKGEVNPVLRGLRSLVRVPGFEDNSWNGEEEEASTSDEKETTRFYHASFHDYLIDESRSGPFYIDIEKARTQLTLAGFRLITTRVSLSHQDLNIPDTRTWGYLKWHLSPHFWGCAEEDRLAIVKMLQHAEAGFWTNEDADPQEDVFFEALHSAITALVHTMYTKRKWPDGWPRRHNSDVGIDETLNSLLDEYPEDPEKVLDPVLSDIFHRYRNGILDHCYDKSLSSGAMGDLLDSLPGFLVMSPEQTKEGVADILGVDIVIIPGLVEKNKTFIRFNYYNSDPSPNVWLKMHIRDYIRDEDRSGRHFRNPKMHHIAICHRSLRFTFEQHWSCLTDSTQDARKYFASNFGRHLEEIDIDPSDNEMCTKSILGLLDHLGCLTFCQPEQRNAPYPVLITIWFAISRILQWVQRQRLEYTGDSSEVEEKLDLIRNRIYSQILCTEIRNQETIVVLCPHFLAAEKFWVCRYPDSTPFELPSLITSSAKTTSIRISDDFLLFEDIIPSLTDYLTDPSLAGDLYISPDVYHTQFAEYWLERCSARDITRTSEPIEKAKSQHASRHWGTHLVHALPSEKLFNRLRKVYESGLIGGTRPFIDSLRLIITWLESLPEPPLDIYIMWQMNILKDEEYTENSEKMAATRNPPTTMTQVPRSLFDSWSWEAVYLRWIHFQIWVFDFMFFDIFQPFLAMWHRRPA